MMNKKSRDQITEELWIPQGDNKKIKSRSRNCWNTTDGRYNSQKKKDIDNHHNTKIDVNTSNTKYSICRRKPIKTITMRKENVHERYNQKEKLITMIKNQETKTYRTSWKWW